MPGVMPLTMPACQTWRKRRRKEEEQEEGPENIYLYIFLLKKEGRKEDGGRGWKEEGGRKGES